MEYSIKIIINIINGGNDSRIGWRERESVKQRKIKSNGQTDAQIKTQS